MFSFWMYPEIQMPRKLTERQIPRKLTGKQIPKSWQTPRKLWNATKVPKILLEGRWKGHSPSSSAWYRYFLQNVPRKTNAQKINRKTVDLQLNLGNLALKKSITLAVMGNWCLTQSIYLTKKWLLVMLES